MSLNTHLTDEELKALIKAINLVEDIVSDRTDNFTEAELDSLSLLKDTFDSAVEDWD